MSFEAKYNPSDPAVPNIVTAWQQVDLPTGAQYTINNPNTDAVNGNVAPGACVVDLVNSAILPLTDAQATRVRLFQGAASGPAPFGIKTLIYQGVIGKFPKTILTGIKKGAGIRFFVEGDSGYANDSFSGDGVSFFVENGVLNIYSTDGQPHEVYLDIIYS